MLERPVAVLAMLGLMGCPGPSRSTEPTTTPALAVAEAAEDDTDHDGVVGLDDHCPEEGEDLDGHLDQDGCPDPDSDPEQVAQECAPDADHDAIADAVDACPAGAESYDGHDDDDGCPDGATPAVTREDRRLVVDPPVVFDLDHSRLRPEATTSLDALASYLTQHRRITRLEIQGHLGEEHHGGQQLDRDRARVVADALVARGVARERLQPQAYGFTRPLPGTDTTRPDRRNWRIEYAVLEETPCLEPEPEEANAPLAGP